MLLFTEASLGLCPGPVPHTSDAPRTQECTHRQQDKLSLTLQPPLPCAAAAQRISVLTHCQ